jgi:hypothetical protein
MKSKKGNLGWTNKKEMKSRERTKTKKMQNRKDKPIELRWINKKMKIRKEKSILRGQRKER